MASLSSASFRAAAKIAVAALLLSTCAPAVEAGGKMFRAAAGRAALMTTWQAYSASPSTVPSGGYAIGGPTSPDAATWTADSVARRDAALTLLSDPNATPPTWVAPAPNDAGDPGDNSIWSTDPVPTGPGDHMNATPPTTGSTNGGGSTGSTTGTTTGGTTTGGTTGSTTGGGVSGTMSVGKELAWQDSFPAGGSPLTPGTVNSLSGNRTATFPVVSWTIRGGMPFGLTLYHNSGRTAGMGYGTWGMGWTSSLDAAVVTTYNGTANPDATVVYGDGSAVPFVRHIVTSPVYREVYSPPVGFYDALSKYPGGWRLRRRDQSDLTFDSVGRLTGISDRRGNTVAIARSNGVTTATDPVGRQLVIAPPSGNNAFTSVTDPAGRQWRFYYKTVNVSFSNGNGGGGVVTSPPMLDYVELPATSGPGAGTQRISWDYQYDGSGNSYICPITKETDPLGNIWRFTYDGTAGKLLTAINPLNKTTTYVTGAAATMTTPRGAVWRHTYQGDTIAAETDPAGFAESYHYDAWRNRDALTDRNGKLWRSTFDAYGNETASQSPVQYALGKSAGATYNGLNDLLTATDARGNATTVTPDIGGDPLDVTDADGKKAEATYDSHGQPITAKAGGVTTSTSFDGSGRLTGATGPNGTTTVDYAPTGSSAEARLAPLGYPESVTVPGRGTRGMAYDYRGRVKETNVGAPGHTSLALDALGRATAVTDERGLITQVEYDALSRVKKVTNARGDVEQYTYDDDGNLLRVSRGNGAGVSYETTLRGDVTAEITSEGYITRTSYDGEGNVTRTYDGMQTTQDAYDDDGQLKTVTHPDGFAETYTYDPDGRRLTMLDRSGLTMWTYTAAGRSLTMASPAGVVSYGYDGYGNPLSVTSGPAGGPSDTLTTARLFPSGRADWYGNGYTGEVEYYTYDAYGRATRSRKNGGATTDTGYDAWGRVESITHKSASGTVLRSESYVYDGARLGSKTVDGALTTYGYDVAGQLTSEVRPGYSASYAYDGNGNRRTRTVNGVTDTYSYTGDRLDAVARGSLVKSYVYDAAGRPASVKGYDGVVRSLVWDDEDRLLSSPGAVPGTQVYNGDGARVSRGGAKIRRSGSSVTSPVLSDGPGRHVAPGLGERTEPYYTMTYLNDRLGTTNALSDGSGNGLHATLETDAFGVPQSRWLQPGLVPASSPSGYAGGLGVRRRGRGAPPRGAPLVRRRRGEVPHARPGAAGAEPVGLLRERPGERGGPDGAGLDYYRHQS